MDKLHEIFIKAYSAIYPIGSIWERRAFRKGWNAAMESVERKDLLVDYSVWEKNSYGNEWTTRE